jgi:hypothetical protein
MQTALVASSNVREMTSRFRALSMIRHGEVGKNEGCNKGGAQGASLTPSIRRRSFRAKSVDQRRAETASDPRSTGPALTSTNRTCG